MSNVFLCYRHDDAPYIAGWIDSHLVGHCGKEKVFTYLQEMKGGQEFRG